MIVTMQHLRTVPYFGDKPGFCLPLSRQWFARQGLDFRAFVREGIEAERLLATGDGMAAALVQWARECQERDDG